MYSKSKTSRWKINETDHNVFSNPDINSTLFICLFLEEHYAGHVADDLLLKLIQSILSTQNCLAFKSMITWWNRLGLSAYFKVFTLLAATAEGNRPNGRN